MHHRLAGTPPSSCMQYQQAHTVLVSNVYVSPFLLHLSPPTPVFFDDEHRNAEVGKLGVHFEEVGHQGTDLATFERAIRTWRAKQKARQGSDDAGRELVE